MTNSPKTSFLSTPRTGRGRWGGAAHPPAERRGEGAVHPSAGGRGEGAAHPPRRGDGAGAAQPLCRVERPGAGRPPRRMEWRGCLASLACSRTLTEARSQARLVVGGSEAHPPPPPSSSQTSCSGTRSPWCARALLPTSRRPSAPSSLGYRDSESHTLRGCRGAPPPGSPWGSLHPSVACGSVLPTRSLARAGWRAAAQAGASSALGGPRAGLGGLGSGGSVGVGRGRGRVEGSRGAPGPPSRRGRLPEAPVPSRPACGAAAATAIPSPRPP